MLNKIDRIAERHSRGLSRWISSLKANITFHVAGMGGLGSLGVAFLKYAQDKTLGQAVGIITIVGFLTMLLTGYRCLANHRIL
jgi:hypothetical protein